MVTEPAAGAGAPAAAAMPAFAAAPRAAIACLLFNAFAWGVSWWPFRELEARGLHALWATAFVYAAGVLVITVARPRAWGELVRAPALWWLVLASGATNATFNWGVTIGDVVRVVLLFYLMPLWAVLLARALLGEPLRRAAILRVLLALVGAAVVLWPPAAGSAASAGSVGSSAGAAGLALTAAQWPVPHTLAEWLGLAGGFAFALTNVLLRREAARPESARALAMFLGGAVVAGVLATALGASGRIGWPGEPGAWMWGTALLALWFLAGNLALQYGAARVPAQVTAVVMVSEVLFASVSAVALGASTLTPGLVLGAALIVLASLLAARS
jgi:drug/metabolite transporter (DMT)-like permease